MNARPSSRSRSSAVGAIAAVLTLGVVAATLVAPPARASQDGSGFPSITFESYTLGGATTQLGCGGSDCPTIPIGATVDIRVWVDLFLCDPVTLYFGATGAGSQTVNFNGAFSEDFYHTYSSAGIYPVKAVASDCNGGYYDDVQPLSVGAAGGGSDSTVPGLPGLDGPLAAPALLATLFGLVALLVALTAGIVGATGSGASGARAGMKRGGSPWGPPPGATDASRPCPQPHLNGIPYGSSLHIASLFDVPVGAERVDPGRIPFRPGTPTDVFQAPLCDDGTELVYTCAGWFCPNPACPHRHPSGPLTAFPTVGQSYVGTTLPPH